MSEASAARKARFPIVLTIATLIAFSILCGLGAWQVKRLAWKQDLLARIETLKTAPAAPLAQVLARADKGQDVDFVRVATDCAPGATAPLPLVYGVRDGDMVWRAMAACRLAGPHGVILLDLGLVDALSGQVQPKAQTFAAPAHVVGVLMAPKALGGDRDKALAGFAADKPASHILMVETATPAVAGVTPAPLPAEISNRHLEYALTWFGLAVTLLFIYAAMLWRKMRS
ncbi:SURF1 family protein [Caulobacter sp. 602-2]|uniref:SURF1-like protein n=1 Tax=Caulobacter sp. 602-2 TaxID=2710887 RepID=A0A6G4R325_9CAUL|nr:SURF1 family cytochrome oxidase biogenesis protein [Caulobacter sp. 602-2]NGM51568.1 SURF1 family protein [Caulobacter sp. 602-2]